MGHILPNESKNCHSLSFKVQNIYYFISSYKKRYGLFLWMGLNCLKVAELQFKHYLNFIFRTQTRGWKWTPSIQPSLSEDHWVARMFLLQFVKHIFDSNALKMSTHFGAKIGKRSNHCFLWQLLFWPEKKKKKTRLPLVKTC